MQRSYANLLGARAGLPHPLPKAEALSEAKAWLRKLRREEVAALASSMSRGDARSKEAAKLKEASPTLSIPAEQDDKHPYAHPYYWAAFVLAGDPD